MKNTTLCYIENEKGEYLMLHRVKKQNDLNHDKWIGVGGKCEEGESPEECVCRETLEETGLTLTEYRYRGVITFVSDIWEGEYMHLFTATGWTGALRRDHRQRREKRRRCHYPCRPAGRRRLPHRKHPPDQRCHAVLLHSGGAGRQGARAEPPRHRDRLPRHPFHPPVL